MSVVNQMLKDLEQRRARGFDDRAGILDGVAGVAGAGSSRRRSLLVGLLVALLVAVALLGWDRWRLLQAGEAPTVQGSMAAPEIAENIPAASGGHGKVQREAPVRAEEPPSTAAQDGAPRDSETEEQRPVLAAPEPGPAREPRGDSATGNVFPEARFAAPHREPETTPAEPAAREPEPEIVRTELAAREPDPEPEDHEVRSPASERASPEVRETRAPVAREPEPEDTSSMAQSGPAATGPASPVVTKKARPLSDADRADMAFREASALLQRREAGAAETRLRQALRLDPRHVRARELLAGVLIKTSRSREALGVLESGIRQVPGHAVFPKLYARILADQGDVTRAVTVMEQGRPEIGRDPAYHAMLAALYQRIGRHSDAAHVYRKVLDLFPDQSVWWMGLGISLEAGGDVEEALAAYRRARLGEPLSPKLRRFVDGRIHALKERLES